MSLQRVPVGKTDPRDELDGDWPIEPLITTRQADGRITVESFPAVVGFSLPLIAALDPRFTEIDITIRAANGTATYRVVEGQPDREMVVAIRLPRVSS